MKAHVAVVLTARPDGGGKYRYSLSILEAVLRLGKAGGRVSVLCWDPCWASQLNAGDARVYLCSRGVVGRAVRKGVNALPGTEGLWRVAGGWIHPLLRLLRSLHADLVLYPGNDPFAYESPDPALAPVFDLMHRYEPSFPEVSGEGIPGKRDVHYRRLCRYARGLLVDSELGKTHVVESYGADPRKVFVLPYVTPPYIQHHRDRVDPVRKFGLPPDYVFYPAKLWKHKNHAGLLQALALLRSRGLIVPAVLSGAPGNAIQDVERLISDLQLDGQVRYLAQVDDADLVGLYQHARAMVMPTFFGPTNIPPLEAFALGCPVVTSGIYAMPEQLGDAALFCDPHSVEDLADKISRLWVDPALRRLLVERGYAHARQWNQEHFNARLENIIGACLEGPMALGARQ